MCSRRYPSSACAQAPKVLALRAGKGLCPDWVLGEAFVLEVLDLTADDIVDLVSAEALAA